MFSFIDEKTDAGKLNDFSRVIEDFITVFLGSKDFSDLYHILNERRLKLKVIYFGSACFFQNKTK